VLVQSEHEDGAKDQVFRVNVVLLRSGALALSETRRLAGAGA